MRALALPLAILVLSGCTTAHGRAVARAEAARERGDPMEEARAWREACGLEKESCPEAEAATERAIVSVLGSAATACDGGPVERCLAALRPARELAPEDPRLLGRIDGAAALHAAGCEADDPVGRLACLEGPRVAIGRPSYDALVQGSRDALARSFADSAEASVADAPKVAWRSAAACLVGERVQVDPLRIPVAIEAQLEGTALDPCGLLRGASCDPKPLLTLQVRGSLGAPRHLAESTERPVEWISGTRSVANGAYDAAAVRATVAEQGLQSAEVEAALSRSACDDAERNLSSARFCFDCWERRERDRLCDAARVLADLEADRRRDRDEARRLLATTPATLDEPIRSQHLVRETVHRWEAAWKVETGGAVEGGLLRIEDLERAGFAPAGIDADPLVEPEPGAFDRLFAARLRTTLARRLQAQASADCPLPARWTDEWLACWARARSVGGEAPDGAVLLGARGIPCR